MPNIQVANNAYATLAAGISAIDTTFSVVAGTGVRFPVLSAGQYFFAALEDIYHNLEIVKVTARTVDLMTIVRAQEGTTAKAFPSGSAFELRLTAQTITDLAGNAVQTTGPTGAAHLPAGTTAQRDASPSVGDTRFNTTTGLLEAWNGTDWTSAGSGGGGAVGGGSDKVFYENDQIVTANYTLTAGKNAMSAGNVSINDGVLVTVPDGAIWTIV